MGKQDIWFEIDSTVASLVGQRVFYNDAAYGKCLAFVVKAGYERNKEGQIENVLLVLPPSGTPFNVKAALSSDRRVGSFDIAQPGDLTDSGTAPKPLPDTVETEGDGSGVDKPPPGTRPPGNTSGTGSSAPTTTTTASLPGDLDGDGDEDKDDKRLRKQRQ